MHKSSVRQTKIGGSVRFGFGKKFLVRSFPKYNVRFHILLLNFTFRFWFSPLIYAALLPNDICKSGALYCRLKF